MKNFMCLCIVSYIAANGFSIDKAQARSFRDWFGVRKKTSVEKDSPLQKRSEEPSSQTTMPQTESPERKPTVLVSKDPLSAPAFMTLPKDPQESATQPWLNGLATYSNSIVLQGLVYLDEKQWTVWLNGTQLTPDLKSLPVGDQTLRVLSVTPRSATFQCMEQTITLRVGQTYNLKTCQLIAR